MSQIRRQSSPQFMEPREPEYEHNKLLTQQKNPMNYNPNINPNIRSGPMNQRPNQNQIPNVYGANTGNQMRTQLLPRTNANIPAHSQRMANFGQEFMPSTSRPSNQMPRPSQQSIPRKGPPQSIPPMSYQQQMRRQPEPSLRYAMDEFPLSPEQNAITSPRGARPFQNISNRPSQQLSQTTRHSQSRTQFSQDNFEDNIPEDRQRLPFGVKPRVGGGGAPVGRGKPRQNVGDFDASPSSFREKQGRGMRQNFPSNQYNTYNNRRYRNYDEFENEYFDDQQRTQPQPSSYPKTNRRVSTYVREMPTYPPSVPRSRDDVPFSRGYTSTRRTTRGRTRRSTRNSTNYYQPVNQEFFDFVPKGGRNRGTRRNFRNNFSRQAALPISFTTGQGRVVRRQQNIKGRRQNDQRNRTQQPVTRGLGIPTAGPYSTNVRQTNRTSQARTLQRKVIKEYRQRDPNAKNKNENKTQDQINTNNDSNDNVKVQSRYVKKERKESKQDDNQQQATSFTRSTRNNEKIWQKKEDSELSRQEEVRKVVESIFKKNTFADDGISEDVLLNRLQDYYYKREVRQIHKDLKNEIQYENPSSRNRYLPRYRKVNRSNEQVKQADEIANQKAKEVLEAIRFGYLQNDFEINLSNEFGQRAYKLKKQENTNITNDTNDVTNENDAELDQMSQKLAEFIGNYFLIEDVQRLFSSHPLLNQFIDELTNDVFRDIFEKHVDSKEQISFSKKNANK